MSQSARRLFYSFLAVSISQFYLIPRINLRRLFQGHDDTDESVSSFAEELSRSQPYSRDFFLEILCSFRLLFGQHTRSLSGWANFQWSQAQRSVGLDPLLKELCSQPCRRQILYEQIDAPRVKAVYKVQEDFPNLGERLLELQDFVEQQNPRDLRTLWYDRRDILRFHTYWAVIFFGSLSILLSAAQLTLSAAQLKVSLPHSS
jgi:hypothetical protein